MAAKTKTNTKTKATIAATISALSALYSAQLPPLSHSFSHPKTHTRLDLRNERRSSPNVCYYDVHPSSCRISPRRSRSHEFTTALFQSQSSRTKVTNSNYVDEDGFSSSSPSFSSSSEDSSRESPSINITSKQQIDDETTSSSITNQDDEEEEDDLDAIINENYSLLNEYDLEEEMVEEIANMTFITRNGTKITTPRRKATKAKTKTNTTKTSSSSSSPLSTKPKSKSNMDTSTNAIDSFWSWALQSSSPKSTSPQTKQTNRRMQMFAYLSQPIVEVQIIGLVLLSCLLVAIDTLEGIPPALRYGINAVDTLCVYVFAIEFFLRWWSAGRFQLRYLAKPLVSIDAVVVILPLILSGLLPIWDMGVMMGIFPGISLPGWLLATSSANSALLNLRLLRILKFQRVLTDETTYMKFEMALGIKKNDVRPYQLQLARVLISIFTLVSVSTGLIYSAEHDVNPAIPDYFTALYFGLTTLTTVGFGDITPVTGAGRLVVGGSILAGVAVIPAQAASLAEAYLDFQKERSLAKNRTGGSARMSAKRGGLGGRVDDKNAISTTTICGKCGAGFHRMDASFCWSCGTPLKTMDTS